METGNIMYLETLYILDLFEEYASIKALALTSPLYYFDK